MERRPDLPFEEQIRAIAPELIKEIKASPLSNGGTIHQLKRFIPTLQKPDVLEDVFGKKVVKAGGHATFTEGDVLWAMAYQNLGRPAIPPQLRKKGQKIARRLIEG